MNLRDRPYRISEVITMLMDVLVEHGDLACETPADDRGNGPVDGPLEFYPDEAGTVLGIDLDWDRSKR